MKFWERFYHLCETVKKKPNTVCGELGFSSATATHWKNGTMPKGDALLLLSDYFNCSTDYLLGREQNQKNISPSLDSDITNNEIKILELFKHLTPTQQGELIGRAKMMIEQNESVFSKEDAG